MKLAEALLQDKPIKRKGFKMWCKPEIVKSNLSSHAALPTVCGTDKYTLDYTNMTTDDWEIKPEPMKFEFEMSADHSVVNKIDECVPCLRGKRVKVIVEEIVE